MNHLNITTTYSSNPTGKINTTKGVSYKPYILQEYCKHGDLFNYLYNAGAFSENSSKCIFYHLLDGLRYLKSVGKSHLDIKPENVFIGNDYVFKLGDFGFLTEHTSQSPALSVGTQGYNSPQLAEKQAFDTEKADLFSLGALMVTVLMRNPLFVDTDAAKDYNFNYLVKKGNLRKHLSKSTRLSAECVDFLCCLLEYDESKRRSIEQIQYHPWLKDAKMHQKTLAQEVRTKQDKMGENST
eukprot:Mrub_06464.p1 GENE.Mrub_06464~~Mrub_06464.p1  ORF type:complete len:240 (-),score=84.38 Mrub_06464:79-798(-)